MVLRNNANKGTRTMAPRGQEPAQEFGPTHQSQHPWARLDPETDRAFAQGEFGPVEMTINHPVAEFGPDVVTFAVGLVFFLATEEPGDIDLVLDGHDAMKIPKGRLGYRVAECRRILRRNPQEPFH